MSPAYFEMLQQAILPKLKNNPGYEITSFMWQQDGAPPHFKIEVRNLLNGNFHEWIGHCGTTDWPSHSCVT